MFMDEILKNKKVLIAEDEPAMLKALAEKFQREGRIVSKTKNGESALDMAIKKHPDIVLLDILLAAGGKYSPTARATLRLLSSSRYSSLYPRLNGRESELI